MDADYATAKDQNGLTHWIGYGANALRPFARERALCGSFYTLMFIWQPHDPEGFLTCLLCVKMSR